MHQFSHDLMNNFFKNVCSMHCIKEKELIKEKDRLLHHYEERKEIRIFQYNQPLTKALEGKIDGVLYAYIMEDRNKETNKIYNQWYCVLFQKRSKKIRLLIHTIFGDKKLIWRPGVTVFSEDFHSVFYKETEKSNLENEKKCFLDAMKSLPEFRLLVLTNQLTIEDSE